MRISILVTEQSSTLIQHLLAIQPLATQASVAREAFELGLATLAAEAEQPKDEPDLTGAERAIVILEQAPALKTVGTNEVSNVGDTGKATPEEAQAAPAPEPQNWPPLELLVNGDEDRELAELFDSL